MVYVPGAQNVEPGMLFVNVGAGEVNVKVIGIVDVPVANCGDNCTQELAQVIALGVNTALYFGTNISL